MEERLQSLSKSLTEFVKHDKLVVEPGDLIEFRRILGIYSHWGVYVGDKYVIHLTFGRDGVEIRRDKLDKIAMDGECRVNNLESAAESRSLTPKRKHEVMADAYSYLNQFRKGTVQYSVADYNCEHFATLCLFGEAFSEQAENIKDKPRLHFLSQFIDSSVAKSD